MCGKINLSIHSEELSYILPEPLFLLFLNTSLFLNTNCECSVVVEEVWCGY